MSENTLVYSECSSNPFSASVLYVKYRQRHIRSLRCIPYYVFLSRVQKMSWVEHKTQTLLCPVQRTAFKNDFNITSTTVVTLKFLYLIFLSDFG